MTARQMLLHPTTLYVSPSGSDTNSGLTPNLAFATLQRAWQWAQNVDLAGNQITVELRKSAYTQSLNMTGSLVGATSPSSFSIVGSGTPPNFEDCILLPPAGYNCISAAWGAMAAISGLLLDGSTSGQDLLAVGQNSVVMIGNSQPNNGSSPPQLCFGPVLNPANQITIAWGAGLQVMNNYSIWCAGYVPQTHLDADRSWAYYNTNGTPGLISVALLDSTNFYDSFIHCSNSNLNIQAINWSQASGLPLRGTRTCVVEKCGVIDTGSGSNPNYFPGTIAPLVQPGSQYL